MENDQEFLLSFSDLSEEVLFKIFSHFGPKDLFSVCRTCKLFSEVGSDNILWESHFLDRYRKKEPYIFDVLDEFSRESKVEFEENQKKVSLVNYKKLMVEKLPIEKNWRNGLYRLTNVKDELLQEVEVFQFDVINGSRMMVTAHQDGHIRIWNIVTMKGNMEFKLVHELKSLHPGLIWWLEVKQGVAVTAGQEGNVNIIDVMNGTYKTMEKKFLRSIWCVDIVPSMDLVVGGGDDGYVYFWNMSTGKQIRRLPLDAPIYDVNIFPDRKEVYVAAEEGHISIFNIETAEMLGQLELPLPGHSLIYMKKEDEKTLLCSSLEGMVFIWDVESKRVTETFKSGGAGWSVSLFENFLCAGVSDRGGRNRDSPTGIRIWDYKTKEQLHDISAPTLSYLRRISCIKSTNEQIIYSSGGIFIVDFSSPPSEDPQQI